MIKQQWLRKMPKFYLISWCENFVETAKFPKVFAFPQNFHTRKLGEISVILRSE